MRVLVFTQNIEISGWSFFEDNRCVDSGEIDLREIKEPEERLRRMGLMICKCIEDNCPNYVIIEDVQEQPETETLVLLAKLQGVILGYCDTFNIKVEILNSMCWHLVLSYRRGTKIDYKELKRQSFNFVKEYFGFKDFSEERCEAIAMGVVAHKVYGFLDGN